MELLGGREREKALPHRHGLLSSTLLVYCGINISANKEVHSFNNIILCASVGWVWTVTIMMRGIEMQERSKNNNITKDA